MTEVEKGAVERVAELEDENALLRASLAEMRRQVADLEQLADIDTLTPLPNRRRFLRELERVIAHANRHQTPAALLNIDVENLKAINDRHGRLAGDAALIHVAKLLSSLVRSTDIVARIGGDEFGLILDHLDHDSAIAAADRLGQCIAHCPLDMGGALIAVEATVGVATIVAGDTVEGVLRRADRNTLLAKAEAQQSLR